LLGAENGIWSRYFVSFFRIIFVFIKKKFAIKKIIVKNRRQKKKRKEKIGGRIEVIDFRRFFSGKYALYRTGCRRWYLDEFLDLRRVFLSFGWFGTLRPHHVPPTHISSSRINNCTLNLTFDYPQLINSFCFF